MSIPEACIEAALVKIDDNPTWGNRDRARRVIDALADELPESAVEKAVETFWDLDGPDAFRMRAAIRAALKDSRRRNAMTQIDELVKRCRERRNESWAQVMEACADAFESQSAELTRLRERNAELEKALRAIAGFRRISGDGAYARGQNNMMAEMSSIALAALASSESVVKSEGEKDGVV